MLLVLYLNHIFLVEKYRKRVSSLLIFSEAVSNASLIETQIESIRIRELLKFERRIISWWKKNLNYRKNFERSKVDGKWVGTVYRIYYETRLFGLLANGPKSKRARAWERERESKKRGKTRTRITRVSRGISESIRDSSLIVTALIARQIYVQEGERKKKRKKLATVADSSRFFDLKLSN